MTRSLALAALLAAAGFVATADDAATPAERPATPLSAIKSGEPMRMTYELKASAWAFILPITGKARFTADIKDDTYEITSKVKTTGLADILVNYDLSLQATGYTREDRLDTYGYVSQNRDGKKNRRVEMVYGADDVAMTAKPTFGNLGEPPAAPEQKLDATDPITALITFALEPRDTSGDNPCGGPLKIFDGRQLTHLHLDYAGRTSVKSDAWSGEALECHVTMDKVAGYKKGEADNDNLSGIDGPLRMYLAELPNGSTPPVRIEADTDDIGKVTLQASVLKFEPLVIEEASVGSGGG